MAHVDCKGLVLKYVTRHPSRQAISDIVEGLESEGIVISRPTVTNWIRVLAAEGSIRLEWVGKQMEVRGK